MPSTSPFGMSPASGRVTSPDTTLFDSRSLLESLPAPDAAINGFADSMPGDQLPQPTSTLVEEQPAGSGGQNSRGAGANDPEDELDAAEQRLWDEVKEVIATFGPLVGGVKIKIPGSKQHIIVHSYLLIRKSAFCRAALANNAGQGRPRTLAVPISSSTTLAHFLKWVYSDTISPAHETACPCCAESSVSWPQLVNLWIFASNMGMPKLQSHSIDILVSKMNNREGEIAHIRAAFSLLWPGKNKAQPQVAQSDADKPLRKFMLDWFANPLYQTKAEADQLWAGGLSRSFYRDYALHAVEKNSSMGDDELDDEVDSNLHINAMEEVTRHNLGCFWDIKPKNYYVNDKTFATPVGKKK
ncbi:hypothetical protein LA080_006550 [Diaporthe eres]|uniref:BTB domain-containing protein n=1 Tax=Diaporthe vaccinii TaxID=105482 RepID=A0ABR4EP13_9PEZI|nr:hypothetical protein LA080_006550 [Diaporthe eres]